MPLVPKRDKQIRFGLPSNADRSSVQLLLLTLRSRLMFSTQVAAQVDTGHDDSLAAEHDVLFAFNEGSPRDLISSILARRLDCKSLNMHRRILTVSMYSVFVERLLATPDARDMLRKFQGNDLHVSKLKEG